MPDLGAVLLAARTSFAERAWQDAYDAFVEADQRGPWILRISSCSADRRT